MAYYPILPTPTYDECDYATWEGGFTTDECNRIIELGELSDAINSTVGADESSQRTNIEIRKSLNSWIGLNKDTEWIYQRLGNICRSLNGMHWRFDISGFAEDLQYTRYNSDGCFYGWHIDNGVKGSEFPQRKLSITLQLSDASEY